MEDIAIVGIGLRFPGDANSPEELWKVLERAESQWSEFPKDRLNIDGYYHPGGDRLGSISFRGAHFLKENVATFDAPFFGVSADEADAVDPQQRTLLEASYEAFENAGIRKEDVEGSDTAVYVGSFVKDYEQICLRDPDWAPRYAATGNGIAIMANRISYAFDLNGPSMTIDTGCSGSLVTVHMAVQSLRSGECSLALAAGAGMILTPNTIMPMTALNFLSPDGKCFTFDSRANGYGRGEGVGVVVLKRLSDAIHDNDTIRAVVRGTRVNQDGRTTGITLPSKEAQVANISALYRSTGLDFNQTGYVECHGTGTQAGDWRELKAISETIAADREVDNPIVVGSLKPNIGHLEGAAGIAGLIKGVMVLERGQIPPQINYKNPNPDIDFKQWKVKVPQKVLDWPLSGTRRASVNCFGFGGTNAHVILDEAPAYLQERGMVGNHMSVDSSSTHVKTNGTSRHASKANLFCFSSNEKLGVHRILESQIPFVESATDHDFLENYAYTLNSRRSKMEWKGAIVAANTIELVSKMKAFDTDMVMRSSSDGTKAPRICFVFCGQGAQWAKMGESLMCFEVFRESIEAASDYIKYKLESSFTLLEEMIQDEETSRISEPAISQPATTALQVALAELLRSLGITPSQVIGHSSGEIAAAFAANAVSREAAWEVAYYRGMHAAALASKDTTFSAGMIAVGLSEAEAKDLLVNEESQLEIACTNSPRSVTLSGEAKAIDAIAIKLKSKDIFHRVLPVRTAYHSQHMKLVADDYQKSLTHLTPQSTNQVTLFSSVTGAEVESPSFDGSYWVANMVSPVQYYQAVHQMMTRKILAQRPNIILELSPRGILKGPTLDIFKNMGIKNPPAYLSALNHKATGSQSLLKVVGDLWVRGQPVDMVKAVTQGWNTKHLKCLTNLPPYPWNHSKTYWHEGHLGKAFRFRKYPRQDLIGGRTADSIPLEPRWRGFLRVSENPWIHDHKVQKTIVYPAAGMVCMVLEGAKQVADEQSDLAGYRISDMRIEKPMLVPTTEHGLEMALNIKLDLDSLDVSRLTGFHSFAVYSKQLNGPWERNAAGTLEFQYDTDELKESHAALEVNRKTLRETCNTQVKPRQLYELLETVGMDYGPLFQNISELNKGGDSCLATVRVPNTKSKMPANFEYPHLLHPATLDSMFQTLFSIESTPMVPTLIESISVPACLGQISPDHFDGFSTAQRVQSGARADILMAVPNTQASIEIKGLHLTSLADSSADSKFLPNHRNLCTEIIWAEDVAFAKPKTVAGFLNLLAFKYPALTILQVGGTTSLTLGILELVSSCGTRTPKLARLTIAKADDNSSSLPLKILESHSLRSYIEETDLDQLGNASDYHLTIMSRDSTHKADSVSKHRKTEGYIIGCTGLDDDDFGCDARSRDWPEWPFTRSTTQPPNDTAVDISQPTGVVVLYEDWCTKDVRPFAFRFANDGTMKKDQDPTVSIFTLTHASQDPSLFTGKIVISLLDFHADKNFRGFVYHWTEEQFEAFRAVQKASLGIIWVSKVAGMEVTCPKLASVVALGRTLMSEDPQSTFVTVDLAADTNLGDEHVSRMIRQIYVRTFQDPGSGPLETEYTVKDGKVYIPRLRTLDALNKVIEGNASHCHEESGLSVPFDSTQRSFLGKMLKLEVVKPDLSPGCARFVEQSCRVLQPDEVEISFDHTILDQADLRVAVEGSSSLGMDFFGKVTRLGRNVRGFRPGAEVVAIVPDGAIQSSIIVGSKMVVPIQPGLIPSHYVDAFYALYRAGLLVSDFISRKTLVISGLTARGLAAITLCQLAGNDVHTTVCGDGAELQKEELMRLTDLPAKRVHIVTPSSLVTTARSASSNKGFYVVYNPTTDFLGPDGGCVRTNGLLVRASSGDAATTASMPAHSGLITCSLTQLLQDEHYIQKTSYMLKQTMQILDRKPSDYDLVDLSSKKFNISEVPDALRHIQSGDSTTTATVTWTGKDNLVRVQELSKIKTFVECIEPNGMYILAGGLGGLGRSIAEHLFANGARSFAFVSRSGVSSQKAHDFVSSLVGRGVYVRVFAVDLTNREEMQGVIQSLVDDLATKAQHIAGVFQCAAVVKDALFDNMTWSDWEVAFRPKSTGSLNLVDPLLDLSRVSPPPFFIFLASSAGVIGNRSQANYAAGNGFEDALARKLRAQGKHAVAIDLGPVLGAGMLAEDEKTLDTLKNNGFYGIRHEDFIKVIEQAIIHQPGSEGNGSFPAQVTLGVGTGGLMLQNQPADPYWSRTALWSHLHLVDIPAPDLVATATSFKEDMKKLLSSAPDFNSAKEIICEGLMHMLAKAMNMLFEEMDEHKPPTAYGVDSLVAVGVRNWVFTNCGVNVSVFEVLSDKTVGELSEDIAEKGGFGEDGKARD